MTARTAKKWTEKEKTALRDGRASGMTVPEIAAQIGRPVAATYAQARKIDALVMGRKSWTPTEDAALREAVDKGVSMIDFAKQLDRTEGSVRWRKRLLDLSGPAPARKPSQKKRAPARPKLDIEELRALAASHGAESAAKALGVSSSTVRAAAKAAGITFFSRQAVEREKQRDALRKAWEETRDLKELATLTGMSVTWVRDVTLEIGLRKKRVRKALADETDRVKISELAKRHTITEVSKILGRDPRTVKAIAEDLGVSFAKSKPQKQRKPARRQVPQKRRPARHSKSRTAAPLPPAAMAARRKLIKEIAERMRREGRLAAS